MINLPIYKRSLVELLFNNVEQNIDYYERGDLSGFLEKPELAQYQKSVETVTVDVDALLNLKIEAIGATDAFNANLVFNAFDGMTPYLAADERVWVALSHSITPAFAFKRYTKSGMSEDDKIKAVRSHFFARGGARGLHRNNALSCLWWYAYVCAKNEKHPKSEILKAVLTLTDFRQQLIDRATTARVESVFNAITNIVIDEYKKSPSPKIMTRQIYRAWFRKINLHGGRRLYATMDTEDLEPFFRTLIP